MGDIRLRILKLYDRLLEEGRHVTASMLKDAFLDKKKPEKMLLEVFLNHNNRVDELVGRDFAAGTAERYRTARKHIAEYIKYDYKKEDIPIQDVDHEFIETLPIRFVCNN